MQISCAFNAFGARRRAFTVEPFRVLTPRAAQYQSVGKTIRTTSILCSIVASLHRTEQIGKLLPVFVYKVLDEPPRIDGEVAAYGSVNQLYVYMSV